MTSTEHQRRKVVAGEEEEVEEEGGSGKGFENRKEPVNARKRKEDITNDDKEDLGKKLEEKLALAMEVTESELTTGRQNKVDNQPMVIMATYKVQWVQEATAT